MSLQRQQQCWQPSSLVLPVGTVRKHLLELHDLLFDQARPPGCCNLGATAGLLCHQRKHAASPLAQMPQPHVLAILHPDIT